MTAKNIFFDIRDFGASSGPESLATSAIQNAIDECAKIGGTVLIPAGVYKSGTIVLKSNVNLHLESGAHLFGSTNIQDYPLIEHRYEGFERLTYSPLLYAADAQNIAITGKGTIDGQGEPWWQMVRKKTLQYPRPQVIGFIRCKDVLIDSVTILNSPSWTVNPILCENVTIRNITLRNPHDAPNTDGINPDSCKYVHISDCYLDVGDDCIAIKAGTEDSTLKPLAPCENITITNCTMVHGHGGVVMGSEMSGSIRNVTISNCAFTGTDRGIRLKTRRGRGGSVENICVSNIVMDEVICPFAMNMYYHFGPRGQEPIVSDKAFHPVNEFTPSFKNIQFSNIIVRKSRGSAGYLYGLPESPIENVSFSNIQIEMDPEGKPGKPDMTIDMKPVQAQGFFCENVKNVSVNEMTISKTKTSAFLMTNVNAVRLVQVRTEDMKTDDPIITLKNVECADILLTDTFKNKPLISVEGNKSSNIRFSLPFISDPEPAIMIGDDVGENILLT